MKLHWLVLPLLFAISQVAAADTGLHAEGRVVDTDGKPVPNIRVYALVGYRTWRGEQGSLKAGTTTDKAGAFAFANLPKPALARYWRYAFVASEPGTPRQGARWGWANVWSGLTHYPYEPSAPKDGYTLIVEAVKAFEGVVKDKQGRPLPGATVRPGRFVQLERKAWDG